MYQWQLNFVDLNSTGRFSGADTAILTIGGVQEEDEGNYSCVVSNIVGNVTSAVGLAVGILQMTKHFLDASANFKVEMIRY